MKEGLSPLDYGDQGEPPRNKLQKWPAGTISSRVADKSLQLPEGMTKSHYFFMEDAISTGVIDRIDPQYKAVYMQYFTTNSSVQDLSSYGVNKVTAFRRVRYAIRDMWNIMPEDVREEHDPQEIVKLKKMHGASSGFERTPEEKEKLRQLGTERMTPEFRKKISDTVSDSHTPKVIAKIRRAAQRRSATPEGRQHYEQYLRGRGHRFTSEESRRVNALKLEGLTLEPSSSERRNNPRRGAIYNLHYMSGKGLPGDIKRFFRTNTVVSFDWKSIRPTSKGLIRYNDGRLYYVYGDIRLQLTPELINHLWKGDVPELLDRAAIVRFGLMTRSDLRNSLRIRMGSYISYFQQLRTRQYPKRP